MQTTSSSTSSSYRWKYDVFLSFRGEDTRKSFVDHLYATFNQKGLRVFKDDKEAKKGKLISPQLDHAIEESRFAVIVFSKNYASSTWCLDELVQIVHCKNITIFPVFYNVDPSVVRKQTGEFEEAFVKHEKTFREDIGKVRTWRSALTEVANHSGFHLNDGYETQFIQEILKEISSKLCFPKYTSVEGLVGIDSRLEKLKKFISLESHDVRMIGIFGMGGIGKTTIATVAYHELFSAEFEGRSFLANVREISKKKGLLYLQKMLLSQILDMKKDDINIDNVYGGISMIRSRLERKKVLIVLDDVNHPRQLEKLAGKHDWFGMGSRIIITSRTKHLLTSHGVDGVYKAEELNDDEALQFFISKAFKRHQPSEKFRGLCKCVVQYARGLPLALEVLGCSLCGKEDRIWEDALERLKEYGDKEILDILQISFDGLEYSKKKIFLDIACFFKGMDRDYVTKILKSCNFFPVEGIDTLIDNSLIIILDDNKLWMHDLLQQMGRQIVYQECPEQPEKRSRLWKEADIRQVLTEGTGTGKVEGMMLNFSTEEIHCCAKAFSKMFSLRLLKICNVQLPEGLDYLPNNLRLLDWKGYPLKSLPPNLQLDKIIELNLEESRIEQLPQGIKPFNNLESINFIDCQYLIKMPDLESAPNLKDVNLLGCKMLREIHPSLLVHKKITYLNMMRCTSLTTLPNQIHMESLTELLLGYCCNLKMFPEIVGSMDNLRDLHLLGTAIKVLPKSIELLSGLEYFIMDNCKNLVSLPNTINGLTSLHALYLSGCSKLDNLPETLWQVESLKSLRVRGTAIRRPMVPLFLKMNLQDLDFSGCKGPPSKSWSSVFFKTFRLPTLSDFCRSLERLILSDCNMEEQAIPNEFFGSFSSLRTLNLSKNNFVLLPGSINHLSELESLDLNGCTRLGSLPELPSNIKSININGCVALETTSNALRLCDSKLSEFFCINCLKLIRCNINLASSMAREYLKATYHRQTMLVDELTMVFPGSEIPEWFQHKSESSSIKIERPPDSYDNKMVGCAACCVFDFHEHHSRDEDEEMDITHLYCLPIGEKRETIHIGFDGYRGKTVSDHLWLIYFPQGLFQDFVELSFGSDTPALVVKRCGIHPVYEKELKELKPRTNKPSSSGFGNSYELDEDFLGSTAAVDCDGSEDEPISKITTSANFIYGESSSRSRVNEKEIEEYFDDEDEPPSKRLKEF
ncbi:TMV resistance protein N-like [Pistacia vera]|uniref:TMV resistance protein N-like n=1 Tax=Pistacia vera TaxID=55513 RepID=UPI0012639D73|nr:TMV resistance protein N-like [Pistacia vera]XP_031270622.1 TMV resistance protein N-like [Pistacia vera]XP_031270623.1 TMV resistance protein N-like [Pistacia vera]XP_031270624.1 TMV resistance protein N-like [Pistacia vera]XP_031270625.1 TMV resistance protein N-like [Pistacia vera]